MSVRSYTSDKMLMTPTPGAQQITSEDNIPDNFNTSKSRRQPSPDSPSPKYSSAISQQQSLSSRSTHHPLSHQMTKLPNFPDNLYRDLKRLRHGPGYRHSNPLEIDSPERSEVTVEQERIALEGGQLDPINKESSDDNEMMDRIAPFATPQSKLKHPDNLKFTSRSQRQQP